MDPDRDLAEGCRSARDAALGFLEWVQQNESKVRQERIALRKDFRTYAATAARLSRAVERPMCVGVFGPSQSGKSYLISTLARKGSQPLLVDFGGTRVDFVREINPPGGRESTGVVTRFTIRRPARLQPGRPVEMRLLSQTDLVKIIGNSYLADIDPAEIEEIDDARVCLVLEEARAAAASAAVDPLTPEDVHDLRDYFERYFRGTPRIRALRASFWDGAAEIAPRLKVKDRARLFSLLWGGASAFTDLYVRLYGALERLGFAADAAAGLDALLPREQSVVDVQTLQGLGGDKGGTLVVAGARGEATLPRCDVTALIAEMKIVIPEAPWDFFEHTDLLDFPGARSREQIKRLPEFLEKESALANLFLRGKVAYLFQRYREERELTSMLLCIGPSNQEVKSLPEMVAEWIANSHGETPEQRAQTETALFLVLTKFDMEFEIKAGDEADFAKRWRTRIEASLFDFLGRQHDWPRRWDTSGPFRNTYWLRNPNVKALGLFDLDASGRELAIRADQRERIERLREGFLSVRETAATFADPARAWAAGLEPNDGGVSYLAESLRPLCNPDLKRQQIARQLARLREDLRARMSVYYVGGSPEKELERRRETARKVAVQLKNVAQSQRFGELLRRLQVSDAELVDVYYHVANTISDKPTPTVTDSAVEWPSDLRPAEPATRHDDAQAFAEEVVEGWVRDLHELAASPGACAHLGIPEAAMGDLVQELVAGVRRLGIEDCICTDVREATAFRSREHAVAWPVARLGANVVNRFVDYLGYDSLPPASRPLADSRGSRVFAPPPPVAGLPPLTEKPMRLDQVYCRDWVVAFMHFAERNAAAQGGLPEDLAANAALGRLLESVGSGSGGP